MMSRLSAALLAVSFFLGACSDSETTPAASQAATSGSSSGEALDPDPDGGIDGPVMYWREPTPPATGELALIEGTLERDGDCLYVRSIGGSAERHPIVWQYGTTWQASPPGVVLPGGTVLGIGDRLKTGGGYHGADRLARYGVSSALVARADECAEGEYREVAIAQFDVEVERTVVSTEAPQ